jgi:hypothetical protein
MIAAYVIFVVIPTQVAKRSYEAAKTIGEDFKRAFQFTPEITIENTVVLNQQTDIMEFAVLAQNFDHRYTWTNSWLKSTKKIFITGSFDAKVGFDLDKTFAVSIYDDRATVVLPEPEVLSVESKGDIEYRDEHGIWNWVSADDRTKATNAFIHDARKYATEGPFVTEAKQKMEARVKTLLAPHVDGVVVTYAVYLERRR